MMADSLPSPSTDDDDSPVVASLAHVAAGVNAVPGSLHWGPLDLIAYGAGPAVFLYDQGRGRVRASLVLSCSSSGKETSGGGGGDGSSPSSSGRVCCVRWKGPETMEAGGSCWAELASGTSDGVVATWRVRLPPGAILVDPEESSSCPSSSPSSPSSCCDLRWEQTALLRIESGAGVTSLAWHEEVEEEEEEGERGGKAAKKSTLVALAGTEVAVFSRRASSPSSPSSSLSSPSPSPWVPCQSLSIHPRLAHAAALSVLGDEERKKKRLLLAVGTVDGATLLFLGAGASHSSSSSSAVFSAVPAAAARGHGDWVRGVAFTSNSSSSSRRRKTEEEESKETTVADNGASSSFSSFSSSSSSSSSSSLLMATASNDRTVRVWEVSCSSPSRSARGEEKGGDERFGDDDDDDVTALAASSSKPSSSSASSSSSSSSSVSVRLVATLTGHDDWVLSVDWKQRRETRGKKPEPPCLLSVSADRSARLWSPADSGESGGESDGGLWLCDAAVGDAGSAAALGFCGGCFSPDGDGLAAAGPAGAIHVWRRGREQGEEEEEEEAEGGGGGGAPSLSPLSLSPSPRRPRPPRRWEARPSAGGHCARVVDACWAGPDGASLLSVAEDQTARLCTWLATAGEPPSGDPARARAAGTRRPPPLWAEVARPQTHGHDFSCVAAVLSEEGLSGRGSPAASAAAVYASGSEEKVIRVFEAPRAFSQTLAWARGEGAAGPPSSSSPAAAASAPATTSASASAAAFGATLPALGLSNRAVHGDGGSGGGGEGEEGGEEGGEPAAYPEGPDALPAAAPAPLSCRPVEAALAGGTLWPEDVKLYGHGAELSALAATAGGARGRAGRVGPLFASAAAAKAARWATIRLWRRRDEREGAGGGGGLSSWVAAGQPTECHSLTVTRLAFREAEAGEGPSPSSSPAAAAPLLLLLASASRDRSFAVHSVAVSGGAGGAGGAAGPATVSLETVLRRPGAHSRALSDCAWAPPPPPVSGSPSSAAAAFLATSSRDGSVKVWSLSLPRGGGSPAGGGGGEEEPGAAAAAAAELLLELPRARAAPATALAFAPRCSRGGKVSPAPSRSATLAVGLGDGGVPLWAVELPLGGGGGGGGGSVPSFSLLWSASAAQRHAAAVRRLSFAPEWARFGEEKEDETSWLASVGDDGAVRVFRCLC